MAKNWREAPLEPADVAMLEFSEKLTLTPFLMNEADITALRAHGFSDRDILSVILAAAYRNYIVRVADALGVELNATVDYPAEFIAAFGVAGENARTTLYADRETAGAPVVAAVRPSGGRASPPARDICWLEGGASTPVYTRETAVPLEHLPRAFAERPAAFEVTAEFLRLVDFGGSGLGERTEALLGWTTAAVLYCRYLGTHHAARLLKEGMEEHDLLGGLDGLDRERLTPREKEAVRFAEQLTRSPAAMVRADVAALRSVGFSDADVITIAAGVSLQNFVCRVAAGVGLGIEAPLKPLADRLYPQ